MLEGVWFVSWDVASLVKIEVDAFPLLVWFGMWEFVWWMWRLSGLGGVRVCGVELCMVACEGSRKLCVCDVWSALGFEVWWFLECMRKCGGLRVNE